MDAKRVERTNAAMGEGRRQMHRHLDHLPVDQRLETLRNKLSRIVQEFSRIDPKSEDFAKLSPKDRASAATKLERVGVMLRKSDRLMTIVAWSFDEDDILGDEK